MSIIKKNKKNLSVKRSILAVILVLGILTSTELHAQTGVVVNELLTKLQNTLVKVRNAVGAEDLPTLSKATINLKSTFTQSGSGKLSLVVIQLGSEVIKDSVLKISLVVEPPKDSDRSQVSSSVVDPLAKAIIETLTAVKKAENYTPPLHLHQLTATVRFGVQFDTEAGSGFEILPLGLGIELGADLNSEAIHELILVFERET